jgi:hypothetical protein
MPRSSSASPTLAIRVIDARWAPLLSEIEALGDDHDTDANEQAIAMLTQWVDLAVEALATTPAPAASPRSVNGRREPERPAHAAANSLAKHIHEASAAIEARSALAPAAKDGKTSSWNTGVMQELYRFEEKMATTNRPQQQQQQQHHPYRYSCPQCTITTTTCHRPCHCRCGRGREEPVHTSGDGGGGGGGK